VLTFASLGAVLVDEDHNERSGSMAVFNEKRVIDSFDSNLKEAENALGRLRFCRSHAAKFFGLTGWVFEQSIQDCICQELEAQNISPPTREQERLVGRAKVDLLVGSVAIEIKAHNVWDRKAAPRYQKYQSDARSKGYTYLFISGREEYLPFRELMLEALGRENAFFLDQPGDWDRFVERILRELTAGTDDRPKG
jgi:hypothetical protein